MLPRDDARFCNNCGTLVPDHPFSLQSLSGSKDSPPTNQADDNKPSMREQIAQQPPATPRRSRRPRPIDVPTWLSKLDTFEHASISPEESKEEDLQKRSPEEAKAQNQQEQPPGAVDADRLMETPAMKSPGVPVEYHARASKVEPSTEEDDAWLDAKQVDIQARKTPVPELHVKVWREEEALLPTSSVKGVAEENNVENLPTRPLIAEQDTAHTPLPPPILGVQTPPFEEVAELDTLPLSAQHQMGSVPQSLEEGVSQPHLQSGDRAAFQRPVNYMSRPPSSQPAIQVAQETPNITPALRPLEQATIPKALTPGFVPQARRPKSRLPLIFALVLVCLLVFGGVGAWLYVFQPFSIPQITQPQQPFQSSLLGVSLSYPSGWSVKIDQKHGTVTFADSTHTGQFSVVNAPANGQDAGQYLLQEAMQLGMTGAKPGTPLSFAQATWQQTQAAVQQGGANYTETLLVTAHSNRLISIIQQAPQATYANEEAIIFADMRSSFRFLS
jgi:hypothetical protein